MKTSKTIILSITGILVILLIISLVLVRKDMKNFIAETGIVYDTIALVEFKNIDISNNWNVRIKQGRRHEIEIAIDNEIGYEPIWENRNDTLFLRVNKTNTDSISKPIQARITTRSLNSVRAIQSTSVRIENFNIDTLNVILDEGGRFSAKNNQVNYVSFETSGNSHIDITETMD